MEFVYTGSTVDLFDFYKNLKKQWKFYLPYLMDK